MDCHKKNRILVFDDLERICEDKLPLKEVLGLINSYTEHSHLKVIVICNEDYYMSKEADPALKEAYVKYKEKSIRYTYSFIPDVEAVYDVIVSGRPGGMYKDFLTVEKDSVLNLFKLGGENNLRTLRFFIDTFERIYKKMGILGLENQSHLIRSFLVSYMLHTLEYKRGYLKENLRGNQIEQLRQDGTYQSVFAQRYAKVLSEFRPNPLLLNYIQSGYLDDEGLRSQICRLNKELKSQHSNAWILYERLAKMEDMDDDEAKTLIDQSLHLLQNNKYNLDELLRLFVLLLQYDHWNIEGFKLTDEIENKFSVSMENLKKTHIYDSTFDAQAPILNEYLSKDSKDRYDSLRNLASRVNRFAKESECQHFIETAEQGDVYALRRYRLEPENAITVNGMDWKKIGKLILTSSNQVACEVCKCIISFTPDAQQLQEDEIISIQDIFLPKLDEYVGSDDKRIRRAFITELRKHLDSIIQAKIGLEH